MTRRARSMRQTRRGAAAIPSAPLFVEFRPMRFADMIPGYEYRPDLMLLRMQTPPLADGSRQYAMSLEVPVWVPPEYRAPSAENIRLALALVAVQNPDAARQLARLKAAARTPAARSYAAAHPLFRDAVQGGGHVDQA